MVKTKSSRKRSHKPSPTTAVKRKSPVVVPKKITTSPHKAGTRVCLEQPSDQDSCLRINLTGGESSSSRTVTSTSVIKIDDSSEDDIAELERKVPDLVTSSSSETDSDDHPPPSSQSRPSNAARIALQQLQTEPFPPSMKKIVKLFERGNSAIITFMGPTCLCLEVTYISYKLYIYISHHTYLYIFTTHHT